MSEQLTCITLPSAPMGDGIMDWGEHTAEEMIAQLRAHAARMRERVERIEAAADEHFQIDVVRGVHVNRHVRTVQQSTLTLSHQGTSPALTHPTEPAGVGCRLNSLGRAA